MAEQTSLKNIDRGVQKTVELLTVQDRKEDKREASRKAENAEIKKTNLSTWGSIKAGFDAFNVSIENDDKNKITWGKLGGQLKDSVSAWYKQTKEMDNMLGATFRIGSAIWENINTHLISHLKTAFSNVASGVREVLGPVAEAFDTIKNALIGVFSFFKGVTASILGNKVKPEDKLRNKFLQQIVNYFTRSEKAESAKGPKKKIPKTLEMLLFGLGIVIGAVVGAIMAPFRLLLKILKPFKFIIDGIWKYFKPIRTWFGEIGSKIGKYFKPIMKLFDKGGMLAGLAKMFVKGGKFLKPLVAGFKIGFKVLGWPLTILLGIIDAIKGFFKSKESGATTGEAIIAGLKAAFMGFIGGFIDIFGWIFDKILGILNIESKGTADKIKVWISNIFDTIVSGIKFIIGFLAHPIKSAISLFGGGDKGISKEGTDLGNSLFLGETTSVGDAESNKNKAIINKTKTDKAKIEENKKIKQQQTNEQNKFNKKLLEQSEKTTAGINQINQTTINNQTIVEPIPDEIDGSLIGVSLLWDF